METLRAYPWPGNLREMENVVRRAVLYCQRGVLTAGDLPSSIRAAALGHYSFPDASAEIASPPTLAERLNMNAPRAGYRVPPARPMVRQPPAPAPQPAFGAVPSAAPTTQSQLQSTVSALRSTSLEARVDVLERRIIEDCLRRNNLRRKETAAELGISRVTLYNKMKKYGLL